MRRRASDIHMQQHPLDREAAQQFKHWMALGQPERAAAALWKLLAEEPNLPSAHQALARLRWPGPNCHEWLNWFHQRLQPDLYVEIGVESGASLALVQAASQVIAIDPNPLGNPLEVCGAPARLFRQTSAAFFASVPDGCGLERGFNLAFIDGDHRFESVLEDFIALERHAAPESVVLLHDTLPLTESTSGSVRNTGFYTGDTWKMVPCLRALRPDLHMVTLPVAPSGLTVITGLNPQSTLLQERLPLIRQAYRRLPATQAVESPQRLMLLGQNNWAWMADWLSRAGVQSHKQSDAATGHCGIAHPRQP